jgi:hypothetical protein
MNKTEIIEKLRDESDYLRENYGVKSIGLFGSFQRREEETGSDIDLLVSLEKGNKDFFNYMRLKEYLENLFGREVDLVTKPALKEKLRDKILDQIEYV